MDIGDASDGGEQVCGAAAPAPGACAASTRTCLEAATTTDAVRACISADPAPDYCYACLDDAFLYCAHEHGCEVDPYVCCVASVCAGVETIRACRGEADMTTCGSLTEPIVECGTALVRSGDCPLYAPACFE